MTRFLFFGDCFVPKRKPRERVVLVDLAGHRIHVSRKVFGGVMVCVSGHVPFDGSGGGCPQDSDSLVACAERFADDRQVLRYEC